MKHCQWCDNRFRPNVAYQIYCSDECRAEATRQKIAEKYVENRRKKWAKKTRLCKSCGSHLSIYNDDQICDRCTINPAEVRKALKDIRELMKDEDL